MGMTSHTFHTYRGTMHQKVNFYGTATVGTKGQIVIPAEARQAINIDAGAKLVVFGMGKRNMLGLCTVESVESMLTELTTKLETIRKAVNKTKGA
jgi:AbrB family looped-hinge helix DNA binding protein